MSTYKSCHRLASYFCISFRKVGNVEKRTNGWLAVLWKILVLPTGWGVAQGEACLAAPPVCRGEPVLCPRLLGHCCCCCCCSGRGRPGKSCVLSAFGRAQLLPGSLPLHYSSSPVHCISSSSPIRKLRPTEVKQLAQNHKLINGKAHVQTQCGLILKLKFFPAPHSATLVENV